MKYAISNWIYGDENLADTFARLSRFSYQGVELVGDPGRYSIPEIRALCRDHGLAVTSVLTWCIYGIPGRDMASTNRREREAALRYGRQCVDLASEVGAPIVVVLPAPAGRTAPIRRPRAEKPWKKALATEWSLAVESMRALADYAADRNITLGLEPINRYETYLVTNLDQALRFRAEVGADNLKLHLDTFHMNIEEPDPADAIRRAGDLLVNVHVSDSNRLPPGQGHTDFAGLFRALKEIHYQGPLTLEPVPPGSDPLMAAAMSEHLPLRDRYAQEAIAHLKQVEASLEVSP